MADEQYHVHLRFSTDLLQHVQTTQQHQQLNHFLTGLVTSLAYVLLRRPETAQPTTIVVTQVQRVVQRVTVHDAQTLQRLHQLKHRVHREVAAHSATKAALQQAQAQLQQQQAQLLRAVALATAFKRRFERAQSQLQQINIRQPHQTTAAPGDLQAAFAEIQAFWQSLGQKTQLTPKMLVELVKLQHEQIAKTKQHVLRQYVYASRHSLDAASEFIRIAAAQRALSGYPGARGVLLQPLRYEHRPGAFLTSFGEQEARAFAAIQRIVDIANTHRSEFRHLIRLGLPRSFYRYHELDPAHITRATVAALQQLSIESIGLQLLKSIGGLTNRYGQLRRAVLNRIEELNKRHMPGASTAPPVPPLQFPPELQRLLNVQTQIAEETETLLRDLRSSELSAIVRARVQQAIL